MSIISVKTCTSKQNIYTKYKSVAGAIALSLLLWGCSKPFSVSDTQWKTYSNSRYGFEFPYPSNWNVLATPENADGIALASPRSQTVQIRAWASNRLPDAINKNETNFQTTQGVSGVLLVDIGQKVGSMKLTITQGQVTYYWQGQSLSQEFSDYYPFFYYIAQQYRIKV
ncbi:hypothetical protein H6G76_17115 [Nostoc sp. FACHB-152]|uniref:hypothetical protein n=1 Tax=unclassified Nostoc TaxID=2593658 RepID=UPI00168665B3|nr:MULTISPECIES: hypothetical protein [unclassified Nostoc]MBD2448844.1 hypothetical protein [Nostoc sp. FACHB-152]MBD2469825.1 hypothetical protein [Nostoc sp. FACHB-145]